MTGSSWYAISLILFIILLWSIIYSVPGFRKHRDAIFIILSFVSILVFLCIREPYSDMLVYEDFFNKLDVNKIETINGKDWEILFKLLLYGIKFITSNTIILRCILAIITIIGPYLFIKRYSKNYLLAIVMFIAIGSFSMQFYVLRQAIAISIFLAAFHFVTDKKAIKYCLAILAAVLFHKTAIVLLIIYPLVNAKPSRLKNIIVATLTFTGLIFSPLISSLLVNNFYSEYSDGASGKGVHLLLLYIGMYVIYIFLVWRLRVNKKNTTRKRASKKRMRGTALGVGSELAAAKAEVKDIEFFITASNEFTIDRSALFTIFWQFFATQNNMFCRLANYTRDSFCILVPNLIAELSGRNRVLFSLAVIIACIFFILVTGRFDWYSVIQ